MDIKEYGKSAAAKFIKAYATQDGSRLAVRCPLTFAENMLNSYTHMARLSGAQIPERGTTGEHLPDVLTFAEAILAEG